MKKQYSIEKEGQIDFFKNFRIDYENNEVLIDNTDGVYNGNLFEFKTDITDLNKVLFQAIKYLSYMRIKGESIPANILLISLNTTTLYLYHSQDYFDYIHKIYQGAASKDNEGFISKSYVAKYDYMNMVDSVEVLNLLESNNYMPIRIDEDCIVGWAERYYRELPTASKGDFIGDEEGQVNVVGEIRDPKHFKGLILPYEGKTNEKFKYLMDKLNDRLKKKDLGAFYTPIPYCKKAAELVRMAIDRVPKGNDYIILDRCAGTGNLESILTDEELSHCILSTYEYYEYKVLVERLGNKVRCIIPPTEAQVEYSNGCIMNADAMSKEYIENPILQKYIQNPKCTIILYENPPYQDSTAATFVDEDGHKAKADRTTSFVNGEYRKITNTLNEGRASAREISNLFVWSAFKYYLRQTTDSYIVFSPVRYFKTVGLAQKKMLKGFIFNRAYFHATASAISCILWSNMDFSHEDYIFEVFDIQNNELVKLTDITTKKCHNTLLPLFDMKPCDTDISGSVWCNSDGYEITGSRIDTKSFYNSNIVAFLGAPSFSMDKINQRLVRQMFYHHGGGFYIRSYNYLKQLPLWVSKQIPIDDWWEKNLYCTTSDGGDKYTKDKDFLKYCLIYTCLSNQNKCLSFKGSDGRDYQNELCFDNDALALKDLKEMELNEDEKELIELWNKILSEAKQTKDYDSYWRYGVYQITKELNTYKEVGSGKNKKKVYDYPELNGDLNTLRVKLKEYYKKYIISKMFEYELIK